MKKKPVSPATTHPSLTLPHALLGGLSQSQFMQRYWQKKPLLVRQAFAAEVALIDRPSLFQMAASDAVESRLVVREGAGRQAHWSLSHGPFTRRRLPALKQSGWTLLVQGVDLHYQPAHELLQQFRFIPQARLDDVMISYASPGGGVGPHYDSYDVFLLQVHGSREWSYGPLQDRRLRPDMPVKVLRSFKPSERHVLHPGDMLYLPPLWGHDGVAVNECMTCSVGFRAANERELGREVLARMLDALEEDLDSAPIGQVRASRAACGPHDALIYQDADQAATAHPGLIPPSLRQFAHVAVQRCLSQAGTMDMALGEILSEPKPLVWFTPPQMLTGSGNTRASQLGIGHDWLKKGLYLDRRSRMMYDEHCVYLNGEAWELRGPDRGVLCLLADQLFLLPEQLRPASAQAKAVLTQWWGQGWLHPRS